MKIGSSPKAGQKAGFGKFKKLATPYDAFMESEGIPVFRELGMHDIRELPLAPWKRVGGRGSYIQLYGTEGKWGGYAVEVPGAGALNPEKHLFEKIYLVVEGRGSTEVWLEDGGEKQVFEWQKGSIFSIPLNAWHRIVNASSQPALLQAGTTAPIVINALQNPESVFNNSFVFAERFSTDRDFYKEKTEVEPDPVRGLAMRRTNFVPDAIDCDLPLDNRRSPGYRRVEPYMTDNTFYFWIGQHEVGRYSKAHAHTSAAVLICLKGKGYTYTWPEHLGPTPWQDGPRRPGSPSRLQAGRHGYGRARRRALVSPALQRLERAVSSDRMVRSAQPGPRPRPARRAAHRLHGDGHHRRRHVDPVSPRGPVHSQGVRGDAGTRGRRLEDGAAAL